MKYTLRQKLIRLYWSFANPLRTVYRFFFRPRVRGVKCLVECDGKFLFVRINYAHKSWTIPGGGVNRGETFEAAARRELLEEVGIVAGVLNKLGAYTNPHRYHTDYVEVYCCRTRSKNFTPDNLEIAEAAWYGLDEVPSPHQSSVEKVFAMYETFVPTPAAA